MTERSSFGPELRRAREARGLTVEEIAEVTKVSAALYRGLENNDLSRWPTGLFRRAFIRSYAEAVGLDPEDTCRRLVRLFPEDGDAVPEMHAVPPPAPPPSPAADLSDPPRLVLAAVPWHASPRFSPSWRRLGAALVDVGLAVVPGLAAGLLAGPAWFWVAAVAAGAAGHVVSLAVLGRTPGSWWLLREARPAHGEAQPQGGWRQAEGPVLVASRRQPVRQAGSPQAARRNRGRR
ncbi:MAG: hypothetical protein H6Q10_1845 [Acidobacteria bacterium]|nr:hypothetical protein [Acidobacteriota bacterium]